MARLGDICTKGTSGIAQKDLDGHSGKYPIYGASGFIANVDFYQQEKPYIAVVKDGAGIGRIMKLPAKSSVIGTMQYIIPNDNTDISYLAYAMEHMNLGKYYTGATIPHIYFKDYQKEELYTPPLDEQRKIAAILDKVSDLISKHRQQLDKLDLLVKSQFIKMFGDPLINPMGWEKQQLQELVSEDCSISYGIVKTGDDVPDGIPVFRPVDIVGKMPMLKDMKRTTKEISDQYKRTLLKGHELLITVRANIADTCIIGEEFAGCNVGRGIVPIRTDEEKISLEFLKAQIDFDSLNQNIKSKAKGITLIQLNMEDLRLIEFVVPPMELQNQFVRIKQQADKSKSTIQQSLEKLETLKKSLMQEYFG